MKFTIRIMFLSLILLISCSNSKNQSNNNCVNENDNIIIRWGEFVGKEQLLKGWELHKDRKIYSFSSSNGTDIIRADYIDKIENDIYCQIIVDGKKLFLSNKILNVPGDTLHFIQYEDKNYDSKLFALWVPEHYNVGNKEFKKLFLNLMNSLPEKLQLKRKIIDKEKIEQ